MVDAPADAARNAAKSPQEEGHGAFGFAGLVLDLDACTLKRESGEEIALTRGEFALLREFVRRPGRVLSRYFCSTRWSAGATLRSTAAST